MTLTEILSEYDVPLAPEGHHHATEGRYQIDCPFCNSEGHWRLGIRADAQYGTCWTCGYKPIGLILQTVTKQPWSKVKSWLRELEVEDVEQRSELRGKLVLPELEDHLLVAHRAYLHLRGFDPLEIIKIWQIRSTSRMGGLPWRIFIPIINRGKVVSWTTRDLKDTGVRYINARPDQEILSAKRVVYGSDLCKNSIAIVEGPTDAWRIGPGAGAIMGLEISQAQIEIISRFSKRFIIFDSEPDAQRRADELCNLLSIFEGETKKITLDSKDPGVATQKEIQVIRRLLR